MNNEFKYSYSAPTEVERKEIENIKKQYQKDNKNDKLEKLRKLDKKVRQTPICVSLTLGIVGTLIFGLGLTFALEWNMLLLGIIIGSLGCIPMGIAYFAYNKLYAKLQNKHSQEIIDLSNELLKEDNK